MTRPNGLYDGHGDPWPVVLVMDVPCAHCGAEVGKTCTTPLGMKCKFHKVRHQARSAAQTTADLFHTRGRS